MTTNKRLLDAQSLKDCLVEAAKRPNAVSAAIYVAGEINSGRLDAQSPTPGQDGLSIDEQVPLWDAINEFADSPRLSNARMKAVVKVNNAVVAIKKAALSTRPSSGIPLNDETKFILGVPNFRCAYTAEKLRGRGYDIPRKAEAEQAAAIHWMLTLYLKHGDKWRDAFIDECPPSPTSTGEREPTV